MSKLSWFVGGILVAVGGAGCSTAATPEAKVASAGCSQLGDASAMAGEQMQQGLYAAREVREPTVQTRAVTLDRTAGADLYLRATPQMNEEYLERVLICHAGQGQALSDNDPFHPRSGSVASVDVRPSEAGYAVRVIGSDSEAGQEIWERAQRATSGGAVTVEQLALQEAAPRL